MSITALLLVPLLAQSTDKVVYRDSKLGLQFEHPKAWKVRRDRFSAVFEIPLGNGQAASVQLYNAKFKGTVDEWQLIQTEINRSMKRTIDRQWQEDLLGVPLLLTRISFADAGRPQVAIVGLLYSSFEEKMHFRLTSAAEVSEQAESQWRDSLLTLRTVTGELPTVENPNLPSVKPTPEKTTTVLKPTEGEAKPLRGEVVVDLTANGASFRLSLPPGWTLEQNALRHAGLRGELTIEATIGVPEEAGRKLLESAKSSLEDFESVSLREDPRPETARSGAVVGRVYRVGTSKGISIVRGSIVGYCEGVYWHAVYRASNTQDFRQDRTLLDALFRLLYAEKS